MKLTLNLNGQVVEYEATCEEFLKFLRAKDIGSTLKPVEKLQLWLDAKRNPDFSLGLSFKSYLESTKTLVNGEVV